MVAAVVGGWGLLALTLLTLATPSPAAIRKAERDHCNKTVDIYEDVSSPVVTAATWGRPLTCWYRFRSFRGTPRDWILRVRFKKFKVGVLANATTCAGGYLQIIDGNAKTEVSNRKDPGVFCGESEQPQTFISETSFVRVLFHTDNFTDQTYFSFDSRAEQQFEVYLRYGQHPELYPNRRGEVVPGSYCERVFEDCKLQTCYVQSPAYPGVYPRALHCKYRLNTRLPFIKLYIENEEFNIDGQRCENIMTCPMRPISSGSEHCPYDYIRVYDGKNETSPVIGTFCGMGKFPYSIIGTSEDLYVEFVSSPAGPLLNTGFHFNVGNCPGHVETAGVKNGSCDWLLTSETLGSGEGIFFSVAHWYPPHTSCTYLLKGRPGEIARLYFMSFRVNRIESPLQIYDGDCGESLTLYDADWPDDARIIKTFCDTFSRPMENHDFVSTSNALFVRFESKTGSYSGSSLYYWAHYDFFNATKFGEPIPGSECDETFAAWKSQSGYLRSPLNTLVYKRPGDPPTDLTCTYSFVTDKRLFARVILTVEAVTFKDHPYAQCGQCWDSRADRIIVKEPISSGSGKGNCVCRLGGGSPPLRIVSRGEKLNLELLVDGVHAAASYFKHPAPLFEARYEFAHSPLCGPALFPATTDGEIEFPHYEALGYVTPPRSIKCIWELRVNPERDLWLHFDKIKFASRSCEDGKLDIFLPGTTEPYLGICGENVSVVREMPILSAAQLGPVGPISDTNDDEPPAVIIQFTGSMAPARAAFKIAWTELFHLPRDGSGALNTQKLEDCGFRCPGDAGCISARLLCNGVVNCPATQTPGAYYNASFPEPNDESVETCGSPVSGGGSGAVGPAGWAGAGLGAGLAALLGVACFVMVCRICRRRGRSRDIHVPY
ncbi:cubilin-like [Athalia rosae]|uniref:cubilin-like n=1 Tax=Athalia rosae TaxID=37344 RepID=UPI0020347A9F|nr:cubilin-like [Athalia rosae]XP_012269854.2 cubilin-like [Athalia rosae]XP_048510504.1 cubilin-like [Athalia rosae]XP_048510505.1 cubilin-like [Athalia rosae]XP_048510506.1 cubilin-like [Athalia rosae]